MTDTSHTEKLYFIALVPPEPVRSEVRELKLFMQSRFGSGHALKSPAHVTLQMPFRLDDDRTDALMAFLKSFAAGTRPFTMELDGFDCFAPRVIFLRITDHGPVSALYRSLQEKLTEAGHIEKTGQRPFHPHMTIATRDLTEAQFHAAWTGLRDRPYHAKFDVSALSLLRHNGSYWEILSDFRFDVPDDVQ